MILLIGVITSSSNLAIAQNDNSTENDSSTKISIEQLEKARKDIKDAKDRSDAYEKEIREKAEVAKQAKLNAIEKEKIKTSLEEAREKAKAEIENLRESTKASKIETENYKKMIMEKVLLAKENVLQNIEKFKSEIDIDDPVEAAIMHEKAKDYAKLLEEKAEAEKETAKAKAEAEAKADLEKIEAEKRSMLAQARLEAKAKVEKILLGMKNSRERSDAYQKLILEKASSDTTGILQSIEKVKSEVKIDKLSEVTKFQEQLREFEKSTKENTAAEAKSVLEKAEAARATIKAAHEKEKAEIEASKQKSRIKI